VAEDTCDGAPSPEEPPPLSEFGLEFRPFRGQECPKTTPMLIIVIIIINYVY